MDKEFFGFLKDAYESGLCNEYRDELRRCGDDKLLLMGLAMRQQSIPYIATKLHDGVLTKEWVQNAFSGYLNGFILNDCDGVDGYKYTWYIDYDYANDLLVDVDVMHISFTKGAYVNVPITRCPIIYVSNDSDIRLSCDGFNNIKLYMFDTSKVTLDDIDSDTQVTIYKYSDSACVDYGRFCFGKIKEFNKELRL
jgi:hypothetical protein